MTTITGRPGLLDAPHETQRDLHPRISDLERIKTEASAREVEEQRRLDSLLALLRSHRVHHFSGQGVTVQFAPYEAEPAEIAPPPEATSPASEEDLLYRSAE